MFGNRKEFDQEEIAFFAVIGVALAGLIVFAIIPKFGWVHGLPCGTLTAVASFLVLIHVYIVFEMHREINKIRIREMEAAKKMEAVQNRRNKEPPNPQSL